MNAHASGEWAVVTESQGTTAKYCLSIFDSRREAIDRMNEIGDSGENAEVMKTEKAMRMYTDCVVE